MAPARVFGAFAGRALMAAAAKGATKKAAASAEAAPKTVVKKTVKRTVTVKSNGGIQKVVPVTSELGSFIGSPEVSRTEAVKKVWDYIKLQNLQVFLSFSLIVAISLCDLRFSFLLLDFVISNLIRSLFVVIAVAFC
jgi:hypothetical protein